MAVLGKTLSLLLAVALWSSSTHGHAEESHRERGGTSSTQYLVVLPRVLIGGSSEVVCITLYEMTEPMNIVLELTAGDQVKQLSYFMEFPYACLDFMIPSISSPSVEASLQITGATTTGDRPGLVFSETKRVMVEKSKRMTFVETDKPIYKPGQTVKFRVLTTDENLRPDNSAVDQIWVETPSGVRIAQWLSVEVTYGLASLELPMSSDPMFGTWNIFVEHHGEEVQTSFDVEEYVLPKFDVTIEGPSYILVNETSVEYTICGRYTYGQPVAGTVRTVLNPQFSYRRREHLPAIFEGETAGSDGCVDAFFDISDWTLHQNYYSIYGAKLIIEAEFTETATGVTIVEEDDKCEITHNMYVLKFIGNKEYKDGLPYTGQVSLTTPDGSPVGGRDVHVEMVHGIEFSIDLITDSFGCASFELPAIGETTVVLEASLPGMPVGRQRGRFTVTTPPVTLSLKSHFSPSNTFLQVSDPTTKFSVGERVHLKVTHTSTQALNSRDFRPLFTSKGDIIRPQYTLNESRITGMDYKEVHLVFTATRDMAPLTKVVVYFIQDGEIVADSTNVQVMQSFENQVQVAFSSREGKPGDETQLLVSASSASLCGVGIVDKSVYLLGGGSNNIQEEQVMQFLKEFELDENSGIDSGKCFDELPLDDWMFRMYRPRPAAKDASLSFRKAGLMYLTNLELETAECDSPRARYYSRMGHPGVPVPQFSLAMSIDPGQQMEETQHSQESQPRQPPRLRAYFPETWLWDLVLLSNTSQEALTLTVPDTITEWVGNGFCISETDGIGISSTSDLQAFQPFFVSYTLPYSVVRGETFPVKVTVFNYMTDCLMIELVLSESENFTLAAHEQRTKEICVCGSQSSSVEFEIIPTMIGLMPIEVTATSILNGVIMCDNSVALTGGNAADAIRQEILVEAEGIENEVTKSEFFCPSESQSGFTWTVDITTPSDVVPDTAWAKVTLSGDVMGTTLSNLQNLLQVPYGCGEQNMLTFVPNVLAMQYLTATDQLTPEVAQEAIKNMKLGYQREFNYRHSDGSFSAFGENDDSGSSWLTAYVVRSFYQASKFIEVDTDDLQHSISWLKSLQRLDGCFLSVGRLCHKDMLGGVNDDLTLSAYIIISLLEADEDPTDSTIARGVACLENRLSSTDDTYALSQIAYALALANSSQVRDVIQTLEERSVYEDGGKHWTSNRRTVEGMVRHTSSSSDVEMTAYVLMTYMALYSHSEVVIDGLPVSKWLVQRRNARGGFGSTQDTVVGLTALSRFAKYTMGGKLNVSLTVESSQSQDWGMSKELIATNQNRLVLQQVYMSEVPTTLNFRGSGEGCALLQVSSFYNTYPEEPELPEFELLVSASDGSFDCSKFYVTVCASYTGDDGASNMAVIDFRLQSGYVATKDSLEILMELVPTLKRYELDGKSVLFYFDEITISPTCVEFTMVQDIKVKDKKPSFATIYDYYDTDVKKTLTYSLECSLEPELPLQPQARVWGEILLSPELAPSQRDNGCQPKDGVCPLMDESLECRERMADQCIDDSSCPGERKCCSNACGTACLYPQFLDGPPSPTLPECRPDSCPVCESALPSDWWDKFCISDFVTTIKIKQRQRVKLYSNYKTGEELDITVPYLLDEDCDCQLDLDQKYVVFTNAESYDQAEPRLHLSETSLIFPFKRKLLRLFERAACPTTR